MPGMDDLKGFWAAILSEDVTLIREAWVGLAREEAEAARAHLRRMIEDEEYSESQRRAARAAMEVIRRYSSEAA